METVFWDIRGIILIDYLAKSKRINRQYHANFLDQLKAQIKKNRPHLARRKVLIQQDNARVHTCMVTMSKLHQLRFKLLPHPPYSPDRTLRNFFLFLSLNKFLRGKIYGSDAEVEGAVKQYFSDSEQKLLPDGLEGWKKSWTKCNNIFPFSLLPQGNLFIVK